MASLTLSCLQVYSIASVLTILDIFEVVDFTTATESWGIRDFPAIPQANAITELNLVKGV